MDYQFENFGKEIPYTFESGDYSNGDPKNYNFKVQGKNNGITQHTIYKDMLDPIINNDFEFDSYEIIKTEETNSIGITEPKKISQKIHYY